MKLPQAYDLGSVLLAGVTPSTGWTTPSVIYDGMRRTHASALALDGDVKGRVTRQAFQQAWAAWLAGWVAFFDRVMDHKVGNLVMTDAIAAQAEAYRKELAGTWYPAFEAEKVGPPTAKPPETPEIPPEPEKKESGGFSVPWWGWMLGGALVVGAGYLVYRQARELQAKKRALEEGVLPMLLSAQMGPQLGPAVAQAATARDVMYAPPPGYVPYVPR